MVAAISKCGPCHPLPLLIETKSLNVPNNVATFLQMLFIKSIGFTYLFFFLTSISVCNLIKKLVGLHETFMVIGYIFSASDAFTVSTFVLFFD